jgi:hypothetical protein
MSVSQDVLRLIPADRILAWHDTLANGGTIRTDRLPDYDKAVVLAIIRWMNGCNFDHTDPEHGERAYANVAAVLTSRGPNGV